LAFLVQDSGLSALAGAGRGLGYGHWGGGGGAPGIPRSLAVEFDTYQNTELDWGDPNGNHVSVHTGGTAANSAKEAYSLGSTISIPNLSDGLVHQVTIDYHDGQLQVYVDDSGSPRLTIAVNLAAILSLQDGHAWVGFTSATGGEWERHAVLSWTFSETGAPLPPFEILSATFDDDIYQNGVDTAHLTVVTKNNWGSSSTLQLNASLDSNLGDHFVVGSESFSLNPGGQRTSTFTWPVPAGSQSWQGDLTITLTQSGTVVATRHSDNVISGIPGEALDNATYHLGDTPYPSGGCTPLSPSGTSKTVFFQLSAAELEEMQSPGGTVRLRYADVDLAGAARVWFNEESIGTLPLHAGCATQASFDRTVTTLLRTGGNRLRVEAAGTGDLDDIIVGSFALLKTSLESGVTATVTTHRDVARFAIEKESAPYDGVDVVVLENGVPIRSVRPRNGQAEVATLWSGTFGYEIREPLEGGGRVLADGEFVIDTTNEPPQITLALASPGSVGNGGTEQTMLHVTAADPDGELEGVYVDLRQLGGQSRVAMTGIGNEYALAEAIASTVPASFYRLPVQAQDDQGAASDTTISLIVTPSGGTADTTITVLGFVISASQIDQTQPGVFTAMGNVRMTHSSGLPLILDAAGGLQVTLNPPQIVSQGTVTLKADLGGELGVVDLARGEFNITEGSGLTLDQAANRLLDEAVGFALQTDGMDIDLEFGADPGIRITTEMVLDAVDGVMGNNAPTAHVIATLHQGGHVTGSLSATDGGVFRWNLKAGTLSMAGASWNDQRITIQDASFRFADGTFDADGFSVTVPQLEVDSEGIHAESARVDDFSFQYGGFTFNVDKAVFTNDFFRADTSCVAFDLPSGEVSSCVYDIEIAEGRVTLAGGEIRVPPLKVGTYDLGGIYGHFDVDEDGNFVLKAEGELAIPGLATVPIEFGLNSQCEYLLQRFCMSAEFQGRGVPIGSTGFLLTDVGGCLTDPVCGNQWVIEFTARVCSADRIVPPDLSLISGDVRMALITDPFEINADGTISLVGNPLAAGGFKLWPTHFYGYGRVEIPPAVAFLRAETGLNIYWSPEFSFLGTADGNLVIPTGQIPFWDEDIALANFHSEVDMTGIRGDFYIPSPQDWLLSVTANFRWTGDYSFDAHLRWPFFYMDPATGRQLGVARYRRTPVYADGAGRLLVEGSAGVPSSAPFLGGGSPSGRRPDVIRSGAGQWTALSGMPGATPQGSIRGLLPGGLRLESFRDTIETIQIPSDSSPLIVHVVEKPESTGVELAVSLISPGGTVIDSTYCQSHPGFRYAKGVDHVLFRVNQPEPGSWQVVIADIDPGEEYVLDARFLNEPPSVQLTSPTQNQSGSTEAAFQIGWTAADPEQDSLRVTLMAIRATTRKVGDGGKSRTDSLDAGPWTIAADLPDSVTTFTWLPRSMRDGTYRIVARATDSYDQVRADTSAYTIALANTSPPAKPTGLSVRVGPEKLRLRWQRGMEPDLAGYRIFWQRQDTTVVDTMDVGDVSQYVIRSLVNYSPYRLRIEAFDVMGNTSTPSDSVVAAPSPLGDADAPMVPQDLAATYDAPGNVLTLSWIEVPDAVSYRIFYDTDVVGAYSGSGGQEGNSPLLQARTGSVTLTGLARGATYYCAVSALDGFGNESPSSDPLAVLVTDFVDSDGDNLPDDWEMASFGSLNYGAAEDPDGDLLTNLQELNETHTHPDRKDTDGDQVPDGQDPYPLSASDLDRDGMPDDWEALYNVSSPSADEDQDLLTNLREFTEHASPRDPDTDQDGLGDGFEADSVRTDPSNSDTDGGGEWDGSEYFSGRNPLNPADDTPEAMDVEDPATSPPDITTLGTLGPNPFSNSLVVRFALATGGHVHLRVFDVSGREVRCLLDGDRPQGMWQETWDARDPSGASLPAGVYYVRFEAGAVQLSRKAILLR
jgi:hypothetical protein